MKLKILSYNILHGFHTYEGEFEKERLTATQKLVKQVSPDILGLPEACYNGPNKYNLQLNYKKLFDFKYGQNLTVRKEWGISLLSNPEIEYTQSVHHEHGMGIVAHLKKSNLTLALIHPHARANDHERAEFVKVILDSLKKPYILFGDFNSLSNDDTYDKQQMYKSFKHFAGTSYKQSVNSFLDMQVLPLIKSYGLKDVLLSQKTQEPTIPTALVKHPIDNSPLRLDYFFASKDIKVKSASTIVNKYSEIGSDHYPIVCEIEV